MSKGNYHPCHKLSVPSAKLFWCRHCMQMFEDAISRWKHSKICRKNYTPVKDQDGQVVQMYVKPDVVSYTDNNLPGQKVYHKPIVKKTSADLKCQICNTKFYSLNDMREHVKFPCQKSYYIEEKSTETGIGINFQQDSVNYKIRRVELDDTSIQSSTALAVLAEASQHVESLSHRQRATLQGDKNIQQQIGQFLYSVPEAEQVVEVAPVNTTYSTINSVPVITTDSTGLVKAEEVVEVAPVNTTYSTINSVPLITTDSTGVLPRSDLEPLNICIQAEDGQVLPETALNEESIEFYLKEVALSVPVGQVLQIQLKNDIIKQFVVGPNGTVYPRESIFEGIEETVIQSDQDGVEITDAVTNSVEPGLVYSLVTDTESEPSVSGTNKDIDGVNLLLSSGEIPAKTGEISVTSGETGNYLVAGSIPQNSVTISTANSEEGSLIAKHIARHINQQVINLNSSNLIADSEHSYQLPYTQPGPSEVLIEAQLQQADQGNQVNFDILEEKEKPCQLEIQNIVSLVQPGVYVEGVTKVVVPENNIYHQDNGYPEPVIENRNSGTTEQVKINPKVVEVPVVYFQDSDNSEIVQAADIVDNLVQSLSSE